MTNLRQLSLACSLALTGITGSAIASDYRVEVTNLTSGMHFTPLIVSAHPQSAHMFRGGESASAELQAIAEGGNTSGMAALLESIGAVVANGDGLVAPGASVSFMLNNDGSAGNTRLSVAGMLLPTNDGFVGLDSVMLPQDSNSMTWFANGYDSGTEANDELVGSGAPGESGFPAPPPIVASGTGVGGSGVNTSAEGFVHIHRNVLGDLDENGGVSDINAAVHRWLNPVARITVTKVNAGDGPGRASGLRGVAYSSTSAEIFWEPATSTNSSVTGYEIYRNGDLIGTFDARSFYDDALQADTEYTYAIRAVDASGNTGEKVMVTLRTNS